MGYLSSSTPKCLFLQKKKTKPQTPVQMRMGRSSPHPRKLQSHARLRWKKTSLYLHSRFQRQCSVCGGKSFPTLLDGSQAFSNTRALCLNRLMNIGDGISLSSLHKWINDSQSPELKEKIKAHCTLRWNTTEFR